MQTSILVLKLWLLAIGLAVVQFASPAKLSADEPTKPQVFKHPSWVGGVAFDSWGERVITGCADGSVRACSLTSTEMSALPGLRGDIVSALAASGRELGVVAGLYDGSVRLWNRKPNYWEGEPGKLSKVDILLGLKANETPSWFDFPKSEKRANAFELSLAQSAHRGAVVAAAWRPNSPVFATGAVDGTIKIWHLGIMRDPVTLRGHRSWINSLDYSTGGDRLASGSSDGTVKVWDAANKALQETLDVTKAEVRSVKFSPVGKLLAIGLRYGEVQLREIPSGDVTSSFKAHEGDCWAVKFSPDGRTLITGGGDWGKPGEVKLWNVKTGELQATLQHTGEVLCLAVADDGSRIAAGGGDGNVLVWQTAPLIGQSRGIEREGR